MFLFIISMKVETEMLKITMISKRELFSYENVCPAHVERQPDFHSSAEDLQFSDSVPIKRD